MIAAVDGDIVTYRCGFASEEDSSEIACVRANTMMEEIIRETQATEYTVFLSDSLENNYRFKIDPNYKANRKDQPKPKHYNDVKLFLQQEWDAVITKGQEADDALGIYQSQNQDTIICSIDKDLLMIPGKHFNFVKKEWQEVEYIDGLKHFYKQLLIGDRTDNIFGVEKIGPVKAGRWIDRCECEEDMFMTVIDLYDEEDRMKRNGQLLWIRRKEGEDWGIRFDELYGIINETTER